AYDANLDHLKGGETELPYPLAKRHFDAATAVRTYEEHLDAWELLDRLGYDGVGFNEHHCSPYGLMNSPNLMAAAAAQRTKRLKLLIYGNLLPLHEPLRLAEELAMIDCLSNGRLISGFARGILREYQVHNVPLAEARERFEDDYGIITLAWAEGVFTDAANLRSEFRNLTMAQLEEQAETMPMGTADEVAQRIIDAAESAGANQVQLAINRGALPHDLYMAQIERFAREVLPRLQAHEVKRVPAAEEVLA